MKLLIFLFLLFSAPSAIRTRDCVCVTDPHPSEEKAKEIRRLAYDNAPAIFTGKVVRLDAYAVTFRVEKRWKGDLGSEVVLSTGAVPGFDGTPLPEECSYQFRLDQEYLVYGYGAGNKLKANICLTFQIKDMAVEEKWLDEIHPHESINEKPNE